ncbi:uncharacterized protein LOC106156249 [Lingula anatina]|uniref:Uncharacterized protein LOC106156249 n=1 Tax=Lingula anatina TaxID=7574 RepID=A0A1S3HMZ8_LINAN|nr:uncharacterized protein LOC106156249 [Lingula anatina]|eukprot:XP_013386886.1 uncharacterized protein LOC106156249 [Lingula anatina]
MASQEIQLQQVKLQMETPCQQQQQQQQQQTSQVSDNEHQQRQDHQQQQRDNTTVTPDPVVISSPLRQQRRNDGISVRPQRGATTSYQPTRARTPKSDIDADKKFWLKLVLAFVFFGFLGVIFVILGSVGTVYTVNWRDYDGSPLPFVFCVIGIVCGVIIVLIGAILGRLMISQKWRQNSGRRSASRRRATGGRDTSDLPPSYEAAVSVVQGEYAVQVFTHVDPQTGVISPPTYTEAVAELPMYTVEYNQANN